MKRLSIKFIIPHPLVFFAALVIKSSLAQNTMVKMCLFYENSSGHARSYPIINQNCASGHVHTFYGPQNFHPSTNYQDLIDTPARFSSTPYVENQSLYWHPTIYKVKNNEDGTKTYNRIEVEFSPYYRWDTTRNTVAFPPGFRMIAHSNDLGANQGGESEGNMLTECCDLLGDEDEDCRNWDRLIFPSRKCDFLGIAFAMPTCWDGQSLGDDNDHKSHMRYTTDGTVKGPCPSGFKTRLPQVQVFLRIPNYNGVYQLSDGASVFHVDFFNGWQEGKLQEIIDNCELYGGDDYGYNPPCACTPQSEDGSSFLTPNTQDAGPVCDADVRRLIIDEATDVTSTLPLGTCEGPALIPKSWDQITDDLFQCTTTNPTWETIFFEGFENGFGKFADGGRDASIFNRLGHGRSKSSLMLRDNTRSSISSMRRSYDISDYARVRLTFFYRAKRVREGQRFMVDYSINGKRWRVLKVFEMGEDFEENNRWYKGIATHLRRSSDDTIRLRFRSRFATDNNRVFIDKVSLKGLR